MGAYFSFAGCIVLILINVIFVPLYSYMACAWAGFAGYAVAMLLSYFVGQKKYPIHYDLKAIGKYVALALVLFGISEYLPFQNIFFVTVCSYGVADALCGIHHKGRFSIASDSCY